jgi:hypothetical protein
MTGENWSGAPLQFFVFEDADGSITSLPATRTKKMKTALPVDQDRWVVLLDPYASERRIFIISSASIAKTCRVDCRVARNTRIKR